MPKTHRIRAVSEITSRTEFDQVIDDIVTMQISKERLELRRDGKILAIRDEFDPDINDLSEKMQANVIRAEKYAEEHREALLPGKKKTAESTFAYFGFRLGNPTLVLLNRKWNWKAVIQAIKDRFKTPFDFITITEAVDKDAIKQKVGEEELAAIGVRIKQDETFFVDPKRDPADPQRLVSAPRAAA